MNRRNFLKFSTALGVGLCLNRFNPLIAQNNYDYVSKLPNISKTKEIFDKLMNTANMNNWKDYAIGDLVAQVGMEFLDTPYAGKTLEGEGGELCRVDLTGMDCFTFVENSLCIARIVKKGKTKFEDFIDELIFTRYRQGNLTDYSSRLHYSSDWVYDNEQKKVMKDVSYDIGGSEHKTVVGFMSANPQFYSALKEEPGLVKKIAETEKEINARKHYFIAKDKVKESERFFKVGDIALFTTNKKGLDNSHVGLVYIDEEDESVRVMHASQKNNAVVIDLPVNQFIGKLDGCVGVSVARPIF